MKTIQWTALVLSLSVLFTCSPQNQETQEEETSSMSTSLEGTWQMTAVQPQDTNAMMPPEMSMVKIFGDRHFAFVYYNEDNPNEYLSAGGTYELDGGTLTEQIRYASDTLPLGSTFTYQVDWEGNTYHQSGVMPGMGENGSDYIIEEDYRKIEAGIGETADQPAVVGIWRLDKAAYGDATEAVPLTDGWQTTKFITPGHFYTVQYNPDDGSFDGFVFGSWEMQDDQYVETIKATSRDSAIIGLTVSYTFDATEQSFMQDGMVNTEAFPNYKIEEHFTRVE